MSMRGRFHLPGDESGAVRKEDLAGRLCSFTLARYDDSFIAPHGQTERAVVDVVDIEARRRYLGAMFFGNLARQLGSLPLGGAGLGRIGSGLSKYGTTWWGVDWAKSEADFDRAEEVLRSLEDEQPI